MKEVFFTAEVKIKKNAITFFKFPIIQKSFRISFWLIDDKKSTFSEITAYNIPVEIEKPLTVTINLTDLDFFNDKLKPGAEFELGVYPIAIASGVIRQMIKQRS